MDPRLSKSFVSPMPSSRGGPSNHAASPYFSNPQKRKATDYISDSGGEEEDAPAPKPRAITYGGTQGGDDMGMDGNPYDSPVVAGPSRIRTNENVGYGGYGAPVPKRQAIGGGLVPRPGFGRGGQEAQEQDVQESYWMVQWRKPQQKTWDGDAVLIIRGNKCIMKDMDGRDIASCSYKGGKLASGDELRVGGKDVEIDSEIPAQQYLDGTCFGLNSNPTPLVAPRATAFKPLSKPLAPVVPFRQPVPAASFFAAPARSAMTLAKQHKTGEPRYDPEAEGAVVMKRPGREHQARFNKKNLDVVDVVVDPTLSCLLRPHQKEGVKFMYECVMGMRKMEGQGCLLSDEMGLGKTLQTITLIHTLLQQNPYGGPSIGGVVGKVLVVSPVSLVQNWKKEFNKWLGKNRIGVFVGDGDKNQIKQFVNSKSHQVLLIGYEKLRTVIDSIKHCVPSIGLIICDEGHRLKSKDNKTTKMFDVLNTKRRIILSGTPVQNDLGEYWAMADFACPGLLDTYSTFNKIYEKPILKSRAPKASTKDIELGRARAEKLGEISKQFVLRRTAEILSNYLPPKHEYVVFIAPSALQLAIFAKLLNPKALQTFIRGPSAQSLALINHLKKICNSPMLLKNKEGNLPELGSDLDAAIKLLPPGAATNDVSISGKLTALDKLLHTLHRQTDEKIVLVSSFTATLDILEAHCQFKRYKCLRLDGTIAQKNRQDLVDSFNRGKQHESFVFLLSAKAGGVGLNLIGASRLVLFDSDWNPSTDLQAMARIHRDGQKKTVHIYRFLTTGTIDEKIFQRQVQKMGLSDQLMDQAQNKKADTDSFSAEELRDLFTVQLKTDGCQTHDLLECECVRMAAAARLDSPAAVSVSAGKKKALPETLVSDDEESGSDDDLPKFVSASQYDPAPPKKMQKKAALDKQAKLAALHKWTHIDVTLPTLRNSIQDPIMVGILDASAKAARIHKETSKSNSTRSSTPAVSGDVLSHSDDDPSAAETELVSKSDVTSGDISTESGESAEVLPAPMEGVNELDSDEEDMAPPSAQPSSTSARLKRFAYGSEGSHSPEKVVTKPSKSPSSAASRQELEIGMVGRKHDLQQMAESGQAGRIMFIFEKVSGAQLDVNASGGMDGAEDEEDEEDDF